MGCEVIYLTGVPGVGKSTLTRRVLERVPSVFRFEYGERLAEFVSKKGLVQVSQKDLKEKSSVLVSVESVQELDSVMLLEVSERRKVQPVLIDSHPVTIESYGFRISPFSFERIQELQPTRICMLTAPPAQVLDRIRKNSGGRPVPTEEQLARHEFLQATVASNYSILAGTPAYFLDNSDGSEEALEKIVEWLAK